MSSGKREKLMIQFVKVRVPEGTWADVRILAATLGCSMQDLAGWLLWRGLEPLLEMRTKYLSTESQSLLEELEKVQAAIVKYSEEV